MTEVGEPIRIGIAYDGFDEATLATFRAVSPRLVFDITERTGRAATDEVITPQTDALIGHVLPSDLTRAPRLRWLQILSAGAESALDVGGGTWPSGITLTNARGCYAGAIAQFTLAALLRVAEKVDARDDLQQSGRWPADNRPFVGTLLRGQTLVIVGYGGIGREIARLASDFGIRVLAVKARPDQRVDTSYRLPGTGDPEGTIPERIVGVDGLGDAFAEADFVSVTLPISPGSRGIVSRSVLERLRPHVWLVNTGRGPVIDEAALAELLAARRIGGAALDVFGEEPLPSSSPFWTLPNVVLTPHVSGSSGALEHRQLDRGEPSPVRRRRATPQRRRSRARILMADTHSGRAIERVEVFVLRHKLDPRTGPSIAYSTYHSHTLVKFSDTDGRAGWGESYTVPGLPEMLREVGESLIGRSPADLKALVRDIRWSLEHPYAVSALVIGLEDLRARQLGVSIAESYGGGGFRTKVRAYAASGGYIEGRDPADTWPDEVARVRQLGFTALKLRLAGRRSATRRRSWSGCARTCPRSSR